MAIIRIKRTTGTALPSGLTFGELAFIGATGGATANRLYIAGPQGACVWIGAEILNSPTYWSGTTAETTVPTVSAVQSFVSGFVGATVFPSDIVLNLSNNKSFGKYTTGQTLPAAGKTPIQVITDALIESILPTSFLTGRSGYGDPTIIYGSIPFGATAVRNGLTFGYTINTPGATAIGATLEFKRGAGSFSTLTGTVLYDTSSPFWTQTDGATRGSYLHSFTQTPYDTSAITYRYTILDSSGSGATFAEFTINPNVYNTPTFNASASLHTTQSGDNATIRERGNTGSTLSISLTNTNNSNWINQTAYLLQYQVNNGTWYNAVNNVANDSTTFTTVTPTQQISSLPVSVKPTVAGIHTMNFRAYYRDTYLPSGANLASTGVIPTIQFRKKIFWGATASVPTTGAEIRRDLGSTLGSANGAAVSAGSAGSTLMLNTGTQYNTFVIALPVGLTLNSSAFSPKGVINIDASDEILFGNANPNNDSFKASTSLTTVPDFSGTNENYIVYTFTAGEPYSVNQRFVFAYNGTVTG